MGPLAVDPEALFAAGSAVVAAGEGLNAAMTVLTAGFGANTGLDIAGEIFGLGYQSSAESLLKLATAAVNACQQNGALMQQCAANYSIAEAASTLGGGASVLQGPVAPAKVGAPGPPGTLGPGEPPPLLWAIVQSFVDDVWPNGDVAALHAAAGCWRTFASAAGGMQGALNGPKALIGTLQMPEGGKVIDVLSRMGDAIGKLGEQSGEMAKAVDGFANQVAHAQNNIRDLLHRLESLTDIWHDVVSIFDGDAFEEIKKIARDINEVLHDLGRQARAFEQGIKVLMQVADGLVVDMEKYMRGEFKHFLGDAVGNVVATDFDIVVNTTEGLVKGGIQTVQGLADLAPEWFLLDPKGAMATWKGAVEGQFKASLLNEILHPQEGGQANLQMWKSLLHLDDWSTARPGLGLGENAADALTLLIPGAGEAGVAADAGAAAARGAGEASELAEGAGASGRVGELAATSGALGDIGKVGTNLTKDLDNLKLDLPKADVPVGGRPVGAPPVDAPAGPAPRPVEPAPPGTPPPHSPTEPGGPAPGRPVSPVGPHEPASVPAGGSREPGSALAAPGERLPPHTPQSAEPAPARVPVSPEGSRIESAPPAAQAAQQAPAMASAAPQASTPHFTAPSASPAELPTPGGGGWHRTGDGGAPGGGPHDAPPTGDGPHGPGGGTPGDRPDGVPPDGQNPHPPGDGSGGNGGTSPEDDHTTAETADHGTDSYTGLPIPEKVPGVDYPLLAGDALRLLEDPNAELDRLANGGVPHALLDGYDPLAGRSPEEFEQEFTITGPNGEKWWDWEDQAPGNGFPGEPLKLDHIPADRHFDRVGPNGGSFLSLEGTPLVERATPPGLASQYHVFTGTGQPVPPGLNWEVQFGPVKDAFGQPGGGEQWVVIDKTTGLPVPIDELKDRGMISEIDPEAKEVPPEPDALEEKK